MATALAQLVEDVEVAFVVRRLRHANLLEQIVRRLRGTNVQLAIEEDLHVFAEARRVVVAHGLRVTETLEDLR